MGYRLHDKEGGIVVDFVRQVQLPDFVADGGSFYEHTNSSLVVSNLTQAAIAEIVLGDYSDIIWSSDDPEIDLTDIESWGTKTLPGAGAFYFANYEDGYPTIGHLNPAQHDD